MSDPTVATVIHRESTTDTVAHLVSQCTIEDAAATAPAVQQQHDAWLPETAQNLSVAIDTLRRNKIVYFSVQLGSEWFHVFARYGHSALSDVTAEIVRTRARSLVLNELPVRRGVGVMHCMSNRALQRAFNAIFTEEICGKLGLANNSRFMGADVIRALAGECANAAGGCISREHDELARCTIKQLAVVACAAADAERAEALEQAKTRLPDEYDEFWPLAASPMQMLRELLENTPRAVAAVRRENELCNAIAQLQGTTPAFVDIVDRFFDIEEEKMTVGGYKVTMMTRFPESVKVKRFESPFIAMVSGRGGGDYDGEVETLATLYRRIAVLDRVCETDRNLERARNKAALVWVRCIRHDNFAAYPSVHLLSHRF